MNLIKWNNLILGNNVHTCKYCSGLTWDKVSVEIEKMYRPTFTRLSTLSNYPKYYQLYWKKILGMFKREERQKPCIVALHLIQWCKNTALSSELMLDVQLETNESDRSENTNDAEKRGCNNRSCFSTVEMKQKKLKEYVVEFGNHDRNGQRILYQHDFNGLIRKIHECDNCRCPKTVLENCQVSLNAYESYTLFQKYNKIQN